MSIASSPARIFPSWHFGRWHAVDDRVRGGSSQSHLDPIPADPQAESGIGGAVDDKATYARFWGTLDTQTLGGAGFASQRYIFGPEPLHLPRTAYSGLTLAILPDHASTSAPAPAREAGKPELPHTFTLVLKTSPPQHPPSHPKTPPNPEPASLSYEHAFSLPSFGASTAAAAAAVTPGKHTLDLAWNDFKPVYRGREVPPSDPKYRPFDPQAIYELSVMCRSAFGKQEGEFGVVLASIQGWEKTGDERDGREGCWRGVTGWIRGWWAGERGVKL